jgi:predicted ester cyclase
MDIPPTAKQVIASGVVVDRLTDGRLVETWIQVDALGMLQQLGVFQAPAG